MRFHSLCLLASSGALLAQNTAEVVRSNEPYTVLSNNRHATTGVEYAHAPTVPAGYLPGGGGVPADTYKFKVFPAQTLRRAEPHRITGFHYVARNSAATIGRNNTSYLFQLDLRPTVARQGGGIDPDFSQSLLGIPTASGGGITSTYHVYTTFTAVPVSFGDCAITLRYHGGENDDKNANAGQGPSQCVGSSWLDGPMPYVPDGHWRAGTWVYNSDDTYQTWVTFMDERPVCNAWSNWGRRRDTPRVPILKGHSLGTYYSDVASGTGPFELAFDVEGGGVYAGHYALPLLNVGALSQTASWLYGIRLELDPTNPALPLLAGLPGFAGLLSATGHLESPKLTFTQRRPDLLGMYLGVEYVILDPQLSVVASTGAQSVLLY